MNSSDEARYKRLATLGRRERKKLEAEKREREAEKRRHPERSMGYGPPPISFPDPDIIDNAAALVRACARELRMMRYLRQHQLDALGTVSTGKIADLVLLDADPLADIGNTRRISAVIANGRVFDAAERALLLTHVETALKPQ